MQDIAYDFQYNGLVEDLAEGDRVAAAMNGKRLLFHRNHGVILGVENMARASFMSTQHLAAVLCCSGISQHTLALISRG